MWMAACLERGAGRVRDAVAVVVVRGDEGHADLAGGNPHARHQLLEHELPELAPSSAPLTPTRNTSGEPWAGHAVPQPPRSPSYTMARADTAAAAGIRAATSMPPITTGNSIGAEA